MRLPLFATVLWLSQLYQTTAIQKSLAGVVDWHKALIGVPRADLSPSFQRIPAVNGTSVDQDVLVTVTDHNVLAVLDPIDGNIIWRQEFDLEDVVIELKVAHDVILAVSGAARDTIRCFSSQTGHLLWEVLGLQNDTPRQLYQPQSLGTAIALTDSDLRTSDFYVLTDGRTVQRLARDSGEARWSWESEVAGSTLTLTQLAVTSEAVHIIGLTSSFASPTLSYISLSAENGTPLPETKDITHISGSSIGDAEHVVLLRDVRQPSSSVSITWLGKDSGYLQSVALSSTGEVTRIPPKLRSTDLEGNFDPATGYTGLKDVGLSNRGYLLALLPNDAADLIKWSAGPDISIQAVFHFEQGDLASRSSSIWGGFEGTNENESWVTRLFWSHSLQLANVNTYNIDHSEGYVYSGGTFQYKDHDHGVILNAAFKLSTHYPIIDRYSVALTTSTGAIQLWTEDSPAWTREEGLSHIQQTRFVELPEKKVEVAKVVLHNEDLLSRLTRHVGEIKEFPGYVVRFVQRFTSGTYTQALSSVPLTREALYRDQFGFQKLVIAATPSGKIYAMDSAHGNIVWSTLLGLSHSRIGELGYIGMWNVRAVSESENPVIAVIAVRSRMGAIETVAYHVDAFTGEVIRDTPSDQPLMPGMGSKVLFQGRPTHAFPLPIEHCKTNIRALAVIDQSEQVHFFPFCKKIESAFANMTSNLYFATFHDRPELITGYGFAKAELGVTPKVQSIWRMSLQPHEHISHRVPLQGGPIASYGRVLGDRTTLYKYLNPHLIAYSTVFSDGSGQASVNVIDSVSGSIIYETLIDNVDSTNGVPLAMAENWLTFAYTEKASSDKGAPGYRLVSVELFEGEKEDDRQNSLTTSGFREVKVRAVSRTFIVSSGIKALAVTTSRFGITSKDLIYRNDQGQVAFLPRRLLDPRRPDNPTPRDKEEMLIPYDPVLPLDPRRTLSHTYDVCGITEIVASPALLESTTLLFSYGLDLFGSRITPSGTFDILSDAFNKPQLLLTIAGLTAGIMFAKPAVERKLLKSRWF